MEQSKTHLQINTDLCGTPVSLEEGKAVVELMTTDVMVVDDKGLVHGGFVFGLVDYAAMLAVNDPYVVLGGADVRFTAPVRVGETVTATAILEEKAGRKHVLKTTAFVGERKVFSGTMTTFVLDQHVLEPK